MATLRTSCPRPSTARPRRPAGAAAARRPAALTVGSGGVTSRVGGDGRCFSAGRVNFGRSSAGDGALNLKPYDPTPYTLNPEP